MSGAMRIFFLVSAALILLAHIFSALKLYSHVAVIYRCMWPCFLPSAHGAIRRRMQCQKMDGRCAVECLSFEDKIGGCRAELTPLCCKKRKNN
ncbi:beta-defensin 107A-like [Vulpes lagopus]|uniref:beta-defensin 107A-like n=1 Tax=Vulpes lagopus TaxID=494514 RepID=UPI001BC92997|nr:beta-defensin 107A-like [Vulpes lagopus]